VYYTLLLLCFIVSIISIPFGIVSVVISSYSIIRNNSCVYSYLNIFPSAASLFLIIPLIVNRRSQEVRGVDQVFWVLYACRVRVYVCIHIGHRYVRSCIGRRILNGFRVFDFMNAERMAKWRKHLSASFCLPSLSSCCEF